MTTWKCKYKNRNGVGLERWFNKHSKVVFQFPSKLNYSSDL